MLSTLENRDVRIMILPGIQQMPSPTNCHLASLHISATGSITSTTGSGNKIVTHEGKTHIVWQDHTEQEYFNRIRTYDHVSKSLSEPLTLNQGRDDHARPILTVDHQGYLHAVLSGHNSPNTYRQSLRPNDASEWTDDVPVGAGTYPVLICGPDDTLYLTMRNADGWSGVDLYVKPHDCKWSKGPKPIRRTDEYSGYATYTNGFAMTPDGTLHGVWDYFETKGGDPQYGLEQAVGYMRSRDGAQTWERADGSAIEVPARPEQMDLFVRHAETFDQINPGSRVASSGAIAVDSTGHPLILYISHLEEPGRLIMAKLDRPGLWQQHTLDVIEQAFPDLRPGSLEPGTTRTADGTIYQLMELLPLSKGWNEAGVPTGFLGNPDGPGKILAWLSSADGGQTWSVEPALPPGNFFNRANLERATGAYPLAPGKKPAFIYHDGPTRGTAVIQCNVYFVPSC